MLTLTAEHFAFLQDEFELDKAAIESMDKDEWHDVRENCFDIVVEEAENANTDDELPKRFLLAEEIADITFAALHSGLQSNTDLLKKETGQLSISHQPEKFLGLLWAFYI